MERKRHSLSQTQYIACGFLVLILIGTGLLMLPFASRSGESMSFIDALFTATSASCVTGLVVADTYQNWTTFGQVVILCLIQVGGLGFLTLGAFISVLLKKRIGLHQREQLHESVNTLEIAGVVRLVKKIVVGTLVIEFSGAVLLAFRFIPRFGMARGIYFSVFHAISAFCNGGFDLMGVNEEYSSLVAFEGDVVVNLVIVTLILVGGIGFIVWDDVIRNKWHFRKYLLHSKIVLATTLILTIVGTILFLFTENQASFAGMSPLEKLLGALFSSVTPRTAGFNTVDTAALSNAGKIITIVMMFIGGSPGSTAGGIKTTSAAVIFFYMLAYLRGKHGAEVFGRRISDETVRKAVTVFVLNLFLALSVILIINGVEKLPMLDLVFESFSAIGTVGMSTGLTRDLGTVGRILIMILMFLGRVGSMSFAFSFYERKPVPKVQLPEVEVPVG